MSTLSDINQFLEFSGTLTNGSEWVSNKVLLNAYASFTISFFATTDIQMTISFSNDGVNFDINITKNWFALLKDYYSSVIYGKFTKIKLTNNSGSDSDIRLFTYANIQNASLNAIISKVGNKTPEIAIDNFPLGVFGDISTTKIEPKIQYIFNRLTAGTINPKLFAFPYPYISAYSSDITSSIILLNFKAVFFNNSDIIANTRQWVSGQMFTYRPGQGFVSYYSCCFRQAGKDVGGVAPRTQFCGVGNIDLSNKPRDGMGFGFTNTGDWNATTYDNIGVMWYQNGALTHIPRSSWNIDKANGTGNLPIMDFSKFQLYKVRYAYLGYGALIWSIYSPISNNWVDVHKITSVNNKADTDVPNFANPSMSMVIYQSVDSGCSPLSFAERISCCSFMLAIEGDQTNIKETFAYQENKTSLAGVETTIMNLQCFPVATTWYGINNTTPVEVNKLSVSCDGTQNTIISIYTNGATAGSVWTTPNIAFQPVSFDITGTYTPASGQLVHSFNISKTGEIQIDFDVYLNPGTIMSITAFSSADTDVFVSVNATI
jgi:hypothetical protein